ncbi:CapA family protein [Streptomyces mangrovisoli]|uniref:Capsule synthesis protein CapA domain-containing protein n=1 Tax=Streptomyces mangrovisoli TaxID=1428628 RepID=A0A1J4P1G3_9ACTN|nr:CapA family protein [Streptomyces mangrovisoli]OIJ67286.1 hypothetical protein WN71_014000 [Streptomyces mangrovisoli]
MIARRRQLALALTAVLAAAAACQAHAREPAARSGAPAPPAPGFTLVATGDILPVSAISDRARFDAGGSGYDFRPMLAGARPAVSRADLALCQLDGVLTPGGAAAAGAGPTVFAPTELAPALAATGYDSCSTASGHTLDNGAAGVQSTLDALDGAGVRHTGAARTESEGGAVTLLRAGAAKVAHLAYAADTDGYPLPQGEPWAVGLIDEARIIADARDARRAGADVVVVSLHCGTAGQDAPDQEQLALARDLTAARTGGRPDIDLILGTRTRVPQPYEKVNGTWVVYGLGDEIAGELYDSQGEDDPRADQSTLARFTFRPPARPGERWRVTRAEFLPQVFDVDAGRVVDLGSAIAQGADLTSVRDRIRDVVLSRGAGKDGLVMGR